MSESRSTYRQEILDHYKNPNNYGDLEDPTFTHVGENPMCGDRVEIFVELDADEERFESVTFSGDGCAISQAAASMLTEELEGMTVEDLYAYGEEDVIEMLDIDISQMRMKCALLAERAVQDGAKKYLEGIDVEKTTTTPEKNDRGARADPP